MKLLLLFVSMKTEEKNVQIIIEIKLCTIARYTDTWNVWGLKAFSVEVTNVEFERVLGRSVAKGKAVLP